MTVRATRLQVLGALAIGCAAGWMLHATTGCGTAHADEGEVVEVQCDQSAPIGPNGSMTKYGIYEAPGRSKEDLAVNVVQISTDSTPTAIGGVSFYRSSVSNLTYTADGKVFVGCGETGAKARLFVR